LQLACRIFVMLNLVVHKVAGRLHNCKHTHRLSHTNWHCLTNTPTRLDGCFLENQELHGTYIALIGAIKILKIHKIEHRIAVMLIRSRFRVVAVYIVCLAVCDPKGYADWRCGWCGTGRSCVAVVQHCLKFTPCVEICRSVICLTKCILLRVYFVDISIIILCCWDRNKFQKSLYCFEHALYFLYTFKGKQLARSKIEIDGSILEQVRQFNYLECELSLDGEPDYDKQTDFEEYTALLWNT